MDEPSRADGNEPSAKETLPELWGIEEMQAGLSKSRATVYRYLDRPDFPEPSAVLGCGSIWVASVVREWAGIEEPSA